MGTRMELRCPYCRNPITLAGPDTSVQIVCPACGSTFLVEDVGTTDWRPQQRVDRFEVIEVVGHGAFGTVYKARDPRLERVVALKVPRSGNLAGPHEITRFMREARNVAQLRHDGIVAVHEVGVAENVPYLVSEFVDGITLADWLSGHRPTFTESATVVARLAAALHYAHEHGVVHRDIKPSNVMLEWTEQGANAATPMPRLMDFGLAKRETGDVTVTVDGQTLGTPAYMSPEQARGEAHAADPRSDVYSLGVVLYQLLTGELPFHGTPRMLLHQVVHEEPRRPRTLNERIPRDLETICLKAMAKEPGGRYPTAAALAADLHRFLDGKPILARPIGRMERAWRWAKRRPAVAGLLTTLALILALGLPALTMLWLQTRGARDELRIERDKVTEAKQQSDQDRELAQRHLYGARASLIQNAWRERAMPRVRRLLDSQTPGPGEPDLRGLEWHYFHRLVEDSQFTLSGHADTITALAFSPDRRHLASGSADGMAKVWELGTRLELASYAGVTGGVAGVAISPDGRRVAAVGRDGMVHVWDNKTRSELCTIKDATPGPNSVVFSPDGRSLVVAGNGQVTLYDEYAAKTQSFVDTGKRFTAVALSADGQRLAASGADGMVRVWDVGSGQEKHSVRLGQAVSHLIYTANGQGIILADNRRGVSVWFPENGRQISAFPGGTIATLSGDMRQLAYASDLGSVRVLDPTTSREVFALRSHAGPVSCITFSRDGARVATGSKDHAIKVWLAGPSELDVTDLTGHVGEVFAVTYSPDGKTLATGGADGTLRLRDAITGQERRILFAHAPKRVPLQAPDQVHHLQGTTAIAYSNDGRVLASGGADGMLKVWNAASGEPLHAITAHEAPISGVSFSPDGQLVATSSWDKTVKLWQAATGAPVRTLSGHTLAVTRVAFSPDGGRLASSSWDQTLRIWDSQTGAPVSVLEWRSPAAGRVDPLDSLCFHPDGKHLAAAPDRLGGDGDVKVFDLDTSTPVHSLGGHIYGIFQVVFSKDGRRLASVSCDGGLKVWDMGTGHELFAYHNFTGLPPGAEGRIDSRRDALHSVAFSPDGMRLAVGCRNSHVLIVDATPTTPEAMVQREAHRLVRSLYAQEVIKPAVLEKLATLSLTEPLRAETLVRAERYCTDAPTLNVASWAVVSRPKASEDAYRRALMQIEEAVRVAPNEATFLNTLGVAQYRAGQFQAAAENLLASDKVQSASPTGPHPADMAFLAMAYQRIGERDKAKAQLTRLRHAMQQDPWSKDTELRGFQQEAEALFQTAGDGDKKHNP